MEQTIPKKHLGLAIKYRPESLKDVLGQEVLTRTISNMVKLGRMAKAYVLVGSRGTGKTTTARILAKIFNCSQRQQGTIEPCLTCSSCQAIKDNCHPDVIEIDAASNNSVEAVRNVIEMAQTVPTSGKMKVFIFDEFHMLSSSAFNALLHTIEEPPAHAKFIFATTEVQKIPETVLSRCLRFDLVRVNDEVIAAHLQKIADLEHFKWEEGSLQLIAEAASGSLRDALFLLEHAALLGGGNEITFQAVEGLTGRVAEKRWQQIVTTLREKNLPELLTQVKELASRHGDLNLLLFSFVSYLHRQHLHALVENQAERQKYLFKLLELVNQSRTIVQESPFQREALEIVFIKLFLFTAEDEKKDSPSLFKAGIKLD